MRQMIKAALAASAILLTVGPASGGARGTTVLIAPQQTVELPRHQAVIVSRPFLHHRELFIPPGVAVPSVFVPFRAFHRGFGHVIVFVDPANSVVWPSGFWCWSGTAWAWIPQTIAW
jgi:hypothetical protein